MMMMPLRIEFARKIEKKNNKMLEFFIFSSFLFLFFDLYSDICFFVVPIRMENCFDDGNVDFYTCSIFQ